MPRRFCRACGGEGPFYGDGKDVCRGCFAGTPRRRRAQTHNLAPCAGCGRTTGDKQRVRDDGPERLYCPSCVEAARAAASERQQERWSRMAKKAKTQTPTPCQGGLPHHWSLVAGYDERHRRCDVGTCVRCGGTRVFLWPGEEKHKWRAQSILPKKSAA